MKFALLFPLGTLGFLLVAVSAPQAHRVSPPSDALREAYSLAPHYQKCIEVGGFPVLASEKVSDYALLEAAHWIGLMLEKREDVHRALVAEKVRYGIMAVDEFTTDLPEHSDLTPPAYWDKRARGLGSSPERPCVSCGEENLLRYKGDPYFTESILIHEFAHAYHLQGLNVAEPKFDGRLKACYDAAMAGGLWKGKYASSNKEEYWAEGVQSFFDTNREPDHDHNHVNNRAELKEYDIRLHNLIAETFRNPDWRYTRPETRAGQGHLRGYDPKSAPTFGWPKSVNDAFAAHEEAERILPKVATLPMDKLVNAASPAGGKRVRFLIRNDSDKPAQLFWIDFKGKRKSYGWIRNGYDATQHTFAGHLFLVTDAKGEPVALFEAPKNPSRAIVK